MDHKQTTIGRRGTALAAALLAAAALSVGGAVTAANTGQDPTPAQALSSVNIDSGEQTTVASP
jgi:hypothetical protein